MSGSVKNKGPDHAIRALITCAASVARELAPARLRSSRKSDAISNVRNRGSAAQPSGSKLPRHKSAATKIATAG
ncbi:MAG: hypothetical protein E5V60_21900 [Mesorhizobium sp.]|nr:MAG: hypothetical protein E5V60_21900 [Mesorhizobium sp.]